jgi:hypothetical protein
VARDDGTGSGGLPRSFRIAGVAGPVAVDMGPEAAKTTRLWFMDSNCMQASDLLNVHSASQNREIGDL